MRPLAFALAAAALAGLARAQSVPASTSAVPALEPAPAPANPPPPPAHAKRDLASPADLARDLADVTAFLDAGQGYYRGYQQGSHSVEENKRFLAFLEDYEREYAVGKKEAAALKKWMDEQGALDNASK